MNKLADIQLLSNNRLVILDQIHCLNMQKIVPLTLELLFQPSDQTSLCLISHTVAKRDMLPSTAARFP